MVHSGGFCDNMSRGGKRCHAQHGGGPYLMVDIMLGRRPGLFSTVNQGLCQDFQGGVRVFCYTGKEMDSNSLSSYEHQFPGLPWLFLKSR